MRYQELRSRPMIVCSRIGLCCCHCPRLVARNETLTRQDQWSGQQLVEKSLPSPRLGAFVLLSTGNYARDDIAHIATELGQSAPARFRGVLGARIEMGNVR